MSFQISFDGVASAALTHLLQGVERQLNWHGVFAQAAGETMASVASGVCPPGEHCPTTIGGHPHPDTLLVVIVAVIAFAAGVAVGRWSATSAVKR
jgi:hypothetical protein